MRPEYASMCGRFGKGFCIAAAAGALGWTALPVSGRVLQPKIEQAPAPAKLQGLLTAGAECTLLKVEGNKTYALVGDLRGYKLGERVCVRGEPLVISTCMQGAALRVKHIGPAADCR